LFIIVIVYYYNCLLSYVNSKSNEENIETKVKLSLMVE